jgi:hypothetical protein
MRPLAFVPIVLDACDNEVSKVYRIEEAHMKNIWGSFVGRSIAAFGIAGAALAGVAAFGAQTTVQLPKMVLETGHTEYAFTQNPSTPRIINVTSANTGIANATAYGADRVQIVAVGPGKTTVEFFDSAQRIRYSLPVWVEAPNQTGGGGSGYDSEKVQLPQIVMPRLHTWNVDIPGNDRPRISGVKSSNTGVATARTNPPGGIQIYSVGLGDTWIEFTDNATGTTYQVHVWVTSTASMPDANGSGGKQQGKVLPKPKQKDPIGPKVDKQPISFKGSGRLDRCLIGAWRSQPMAPNVELEYKGKENTVLKGGGALFSIRADRSAEFDFSGVRPFVYTNPYGGSGENIVITVRGKTTGRVIGENNVISIDGVSDSDVTVEEKGPGDLGSKYTREVLLPFGAQTVNYTCTADTLVLDFQWTTMTFSKE